MERKQYQEAKIKTRYFDRSGAEIKAGMILQQINGGKQRVYSCGDASGSDELGFLATNPHFLKHHPDWPAEYFPLKQFNLNEWQILPED